MKQHHKDLAAGTKLRWATLKRLTRIYLSQTWKEQNATEKVKRNTVPNTLFGLEIIKSIKAIQTDHTLLNSMTLLIAKFVDTLCLYF